MSKRFAIISAVGLVENVAIADSPLDPSWVDLTNVNPQPGLGWTYSNGVFSPPQEPPTPALPRVITKVALLTRRLQMSEFAAILSASKTDIEVEAWKYILDSATTIDLDDPRTHSGMALLVDKGLVTQERANEILNAPVMPEERP